MSEQHGFFGIKYELRKYNADARPGRSKFAKPLKLYVEKILSLKKRTRLLCCGGYSFKESCNQNVCC